MTQSTPKTLAVTLFSALVMGSIASIVACGDAGRPQALADDLDGEPFDAGSVDVGDGAPTPCLVPGEVRACHRIISQHAGVLNCFYGAQACVNGMWNTCGTADAAAIPR